MLKTFGPQGVMQLSEDGQNLANKFLAGNATRKDKMQLLGEAQATIAQRKQMQEMQEQQYKINRMGYVNSMLSQAMNDQGQGGQGQPQPFAPPTGVPDPQQQAPGQPQPPPSAAPIGVANLITPPTPIAATDPRMKPVFNKFLMMTGGDFDKASAEASKYATQVSDQNKAQYDQAVAATKETGRLVAFGPHTDPESGLVQGFDFKPEIVKGQGTPVESYTTGEKVVTFAPKVAPQVPFVLKPGDKTPANLDSISGLAQNVTNAPGWQKDLSAANQQVIATGGSLADTNLLASAAKAYVSGGASNFNVLRGNPAFAQMQQLFTGSNPAAALKTSMSANTSAILNQIKTAQGNTVGGRILQSEFENLREMLSNPEMDSATIYAAARNMQVMMQRKYDIDSAYATYRKTMPAGEAEDVVTRQFGKVPELIAAGNYQNIPKPVKAHLKQIMASPAISPQQKQGAASAFDKAFGAGMSELAATINQ